MNIELVLLRLCWQGLELLFVRPFQREEEALNVTPWSPKWLYTVEDVAAESSGQVRGF